MKAMNYKSIQGGNIQKITKSKWYLNNFSVGVFLAVSGIIGGVLIVNTLPILAAALLALAGAGAIMAFCKALLQ